MKHTENHEMSLILKNQWKFVFEIFCNICQATRMARRTEIEQKQQQKEEQRRKVATAMQDGTMSHKVFQ